jgi:2-isopropylmalate synthase
MQQRGAPRRISIFDTTLRDGEQAPGNAMTPEQKLALALRIEALGVDCVEVGFPASSPSEFEATKLVAAHLTKARFITFCRSVRKDVDTAVAAGGVANNEVQLMATGSDLHLRYKRGITRKQGVDEVVDTLRYARSLGIAHTTLAIEDASRGELDYLRALVESGVEAGATRLVIADTTGCTTPDQYGELIAEVRAWAPEVPIATHCHDDFGLALANAVAGLQAGADGVQVTLGGIGERAGNTPLEELAALLAYKHEHFGFYTDLDTTKMYEAYTALRAVIGLEEPRNKAIFGAYAFGTAAGIHQQGILANPATYEYVEPAKFGRDRLLLVSRHSGRAVLRYVLGQIGVSVGDAELAELYRVHIAERTGSDCEDLASLQRRLTEELTGPNSGRTGERRERHAVRA